MSRSWHTRSSLVAADTSHRRLGHASGMGRLSGSGAAVSHRAGGVHLRHAAVSPVRRHLRTNRAAHDRGRQFHHRDARPYRQSRKFARRGPTRRRSTIKPCSAATPISACTAARAFPTACCRATMSPRSAAAARIRGATSFRPADAATTPKPRARRSRRDAAVGGAVHADLCGIYLSQGPPGAGGSNGIFGRAFSALEPAARAHAALADVNGGAVSTARCLRARSNRPRAAASSTISTPAISSSGRTIPCRPDMVDGDGNATHALYGFARFMSDFLEQVRPERIGVAFDRERAQRNLVPQRDLSRLQGEPRGAAGRIAAADPAVPGVLQASRPCRIRERAVRGRRHHRNVGGAGARRRTAQHLRHARQGLVATIARRRRVLGLQRQHPLPIP